MSAENKEIVRKFMDECWNQGKLERVRDLVSDKCHHHDPVFPTLSPGAENLKRHIEVCRSGFPDLNFRIDDTIAERNEVVIHWSARGTHKGQFLGMAPTNHKTTVSGTSIFRIENGKIAEQWTDWNVMSLMEQLGVSTAPRAEVKATAR
ncbi:MAG: ester cyclase [Acidobacteriaceae bacterium]